MTLRTVFEKCSIGCWLKSKSIKRLQIWKGSTTWTFALVWFGLLKSHLSLFLIIFPTTGGVWRPSYMHNYQLAYNTQQVKFAMETLTCSPIISICNQFQTQRRMNLRVFICAAYSLIICLISNVCMSIFKQRYW